MATPDYESRIGFRRQLDVTLPAAVAISSAAVAPTIGKGTSPLRRFLLTLTNIRLGVWLPNPANLPASEAAIPANPRAFRVLYELFGWYPARSSFLYVTDGGFVEDLGLVELLRRRCTTVISLDATAEPTTERSLGRAIAIAQKELGVSVVDRPAADDVPTNLVVADIHYPDGTSGTLIYGKALITKGTSLAAKWYAEMVKLLPSAEPRDRATTGEMFAAYQALGRSVGAACAEQLGKQR